MNEIGRRITDKLIELNGSTDFTIAFLPYKRSMWDSMESVYEECIASGIDAHCMPIPYMRLKQNGELDCIDSDYEYFGDIAESVEHLQDISPRFCVIHYQYNGRNHVTSMLPEYYTENIKARTNADMILLPYGLNTSIKRNERDTMYPGLVAVDYIFCHSENNRGSLINMWKSYNVDYSGRVFAYGSPKIDAILKASSDIPEEWQGILEDKPVTLIVNSLRPFLINPQKRIRAYKHYLYDELSKGHAVIFRPHPLLSQSIKSMRPDATAAYDAFIESISKNPNVIVDTSEYLERALGVAGYLISDPSSVLTMWQVTDKPYKEI